VDSRQWPGVFRVVVRPRSNQEAFGALQLRIHAQEIIGVPIAPAADQECGRLDLVDVAAQQPRLPEWSIVQILDVGVAPRDGLFQSPLPDLGPAWTDQVWVGRGKVVCGHQGGVVLESEGTKSASGTEHAFVPVGTHLAKDDGLQLLWSEPDGVVANS